MRSLKIFLFAWMMVVIAASGNAMRTCEAAAPGHGLERTQSVQVHLEEDQRTEMVVLEPARDMSVSVWRGGACIWRGVPKRLRPWKLAVADVDGDGRQEIIVGVYKSTRFYPFLHNCLFVYGWDGTKGFPKWLGSSLSKPFTDFTFVHRAGRKAAELVSVEKLPGNRRCVVAYSWNGFGFTGDWQQGSWNNVRITGIKGGKVFLIADSRRVVIGRN